MWRRLTRRHRRAQVAGRFAAFSSAFFRVSRVWRAEDAVPLEARTRGAVLREALSQLGPVSVKCGQTLAERPDLIGDEAADALKLLQGENTPFEDALAWRMIAEDLNWSGPLAPGCPHAADAPGQPLFAELSSRPVAAASLAQVYYAKTWDGQELALKVQRPGLVRQVALDMYVLRITLDLARRKWGTLADLRPIADEVGSGVFRELDAHGEAANAAEFERRLAFLGFVRTPRWAPKYSGPAGAARVLAMEWVHGRRLSQLPPAQARRLVDMAVEASVAQLIRTGFVHADPHAGNLLLGDDGKLVFLDFGLMCTVEPHIMEAFASGVCHLLAGDWLALAYDFQDCGLVPPQFEARNPENGKYEACSAEYFSEGIRRAICGEADGLTRFGALATGLGGASGTFRFLCPPFIILLCRTFLTLEGMANVVDPNFSIYSSALPYAVRRALSPETEKGEAVLRSALLTDSGAFRWSRLNDVLSQLETLSQKQDDQESEASASPSSGAGIETVTGLIGAPEGAALRRVAFDADSLSLAQHLTGAEGRPLRRAGVKTLASMLQELHRSRKETEVEATERTAEQRANTRREAARKRQAVRVILSTHLARLLRGGLPGILAICGLVWVAARVGVVAAVRAGVGMVSVWVSSRFQRRRKLKLATDTKKA
jgi:predicted unusual protein kinase regulating ubiquinone biosynthesis (AarF/ABC1/UbiB family)